MSPDQLMTLIPALVLAAAVGALAVYFYFSGRLNQLRRQRTQLETELEIERKAAAGK